MIVPDLGPVLDEHGYAVVRGWLDARQCDELAGWYGDDARFRSTIVMEGHGYGRGEYRYFRYPLPPLVAELRGALYATLAPTANAWSERLGRHEWFPSALPELLDRCHAAGQERPTPLCCATARATITRSIRTRTARSRFRSRGPCS